MQQRDDTIRQQTAAVAEREATIVGRDAIIAERDRTITDQAAAMVLRDGTIAAGEATIAELAAVVAQRDVSTAEQAATISQRDEAIAEQAATIAEKVASIAEQAAVMAEQAASLAAQERITVELEGKLVGSELSEAQQRVPVYMGCPRSSWPESESCLTVPCVIACAGACGPLLCDGRLQRGPACDSGTKPSSPETRSWLSSSNSWWGHVRGMIQQLFGLLWVEGVFVPCAR